MAIRSYLPETTVFEDDGSGVILVNHLGSSVAEDTGRDANYLAARYGRRVIAVDRPGTGYSFPRPSLRNQLTEEPLEAYKPVAEQVAEACATHGVERTVVMGRSAGALGALMLASLDNVLPQVQAVYAAESVGWERMSIPEGRQRHRELSRAHKELLAADREGLTPILVQPEPHGLSIADAGKRIASIAWSGLVDAYHHQATWATPTARDCMERITGQEPAPALFIDFAEHSFTSPPAIVELQAAAPTAQVEIVPHTVHASFDNRSFFADRGVQALNLLT